MRPALGGLLLATLAIHLPFINQAFHMDDGLFLLAARNVMENPFFPQDLPIYFEGVLVNDLASTEHPPLTAYFMAFCATLGGGFTEPVLHFGFLLFPLILTVAGWSLARRFTANPIVATTSILVMPAVFVVSHTLMADVPLLALWTAAVALFVRGTDELRKSWILAGVGVVFLACLISYTALSLVPLLALHAWLRRDRFSLLASLAPVLLFGLWLSLNSLHFQRFTPGFLFSHYFFVERVLSPPLMAGKLTYALAALGGVTILPAALPVLVTRGRLVAGLFVSAAAAAFTGVTGYPVWQQLLFALFASAGAAMTGEALVCFWRSRAALATRRHEGRDDLFLATWFLGALLFCVLFYLTGTVRYLLPAVPPLVFLVVRRAHRLAGAGLPRLAVPALVITGMLSLALAVGDYRFAQLYRGFAEDIEKAGISSGKDVWFTGEWGFRTYLEQQGGRELGRRDARPRPDDLLVVPTLATPYETLFSDRLMLDSLILVAPSRAIVEIPPAGRGERLVLTVGMPLHELSDGLDFSIRFHEAGAASLLYRVSLSPAAGSRWKRVEVPLGDVTGREGRLEFDCAVGRSGNADGDWIAVARAEVRDESGDASYALHKQWLTAEIRVHPEVDYQTPGNVPVFPMEVWLEQEPPRRLVGGYRLNPGLPIRLLEEVSHAGFWSMRWGMLPFSFNCDDLESIAVYEVTRQVNDYGEQNPVWAPE